MAITLSSKPVIAAGSSLNVTKVEFYNGYFQKLGESTTADASGNYNLTLSSIAAGDYNFKSVAYASLNGNPAGAVESSVVAKTVRPSIFFDSVAANLNASTIDSNWNLIPAKPISKVILGSTSGETDAGGYWKARHDGTYLYVLVRINDDVTRKDGTGNFQDDQIEIYLSPTRNLTSTYLSTDRAYRYDVVGRLLTEANGNSISSINTKLYTEEGSYTLLMRAPLTEYGFNSSNYANVEIGIEVQFNDDDDGGDRDSKVAWFATQDNVFNNPSNMGGARIAPKPAAQVDTISITSPLNNSNYFIGDEVNIVTLPTTYNVGAPIKVEFYEGSTLLGQQTIRGTDGSYSFLFTATNAGIKSLTAKATYSDNSTAISGISSITVYSLNTVAITAPNNLEQFNFGSSFNIVITPTANYGTCTSVRLNINDNPEALLTASELNGTFVYSFNPEEVGSYKVYAIAFFTEGSSVLSEEITLYSVDPNTGEGGPPTNTIELLKPAAGQEFYINDPIELEARITINNTLVIDRVEFYVDSIQVGQSNTPTANNTYLYTWLPGTSATLGTRNVTATVFYQTGDPTTSTVSAIQLLAVATRNTVLPSISKLTKVGSITVQKQYIVTTESFYSTNNSVSITLNSLASSTSIGQSSVFISNVPSRFLDVLINPILIIPTTGTLAGDKAVYIYAYGSLDGINFTAGVLGTDSAYTLKDPTNLRLVGIVNCPNLNSTYVGGPFSLAQAFGGIVPEKWGLVVLNNTGVVLETTGNLIKYQGVKTRAINI